MLLRRTARLLICWTSLCLLLAVTRTTSAGISVTVQRVPNGGIQPQIIRDPSGVLHLLYFRGEPAHGDLYYVKSRDSGSTWSAPLLVNSHPGTAIALGTIRGGQIAVGKNGRVYAVWNGSSEAHEAALRNPESHQASAPLLYTRLNDAGTGFEPERNLMRNTFDLDGGGSIAADASGHVYVAWHGKSAGAPAGEAGRQVWMAPSADEGKTFLAERPSSHQPTGACGCCGMALYSDSKGILRSLYRSATENVHRDIYLLSSSDHAAAFSSSKLDSWNINACPMSSMAFAEGAGKVEGAWETGGQVYFQNLTAPSAKPVSAPEPAKAHKHPRLAIAPGGETLLVWTEAAGWNRGGSAAWRLYDAQGGAMAEQGDIAKVPTWSFAAVTPFPKGFLVIY